MGGSPAAGLGRATPGDWLQRPAQTVPAHDPDLLNLNDPPFNNPKVRQALQYAIDRDKMCTDLLNGLCVPSYQYWYEGYPWYNAATGTKYTYDPEKAKALLAEAGFPNGVSINVTYPTGGSGNMWPQPMMELLQANVKAVGVDMKITPLEWNNILTLYRASFDSAETRQYNGMFISVATLAPTSVTELHEVSDSHDRLLQRLGVPLG